MDLLRFETYIMLPRSLYKCQRKIVTASNLQRTLIPKSFFFLHSISKLIIQKLSNDIFTISDHIASRRLQELELVAVPTIHNPRPTTTVRIAPRHYVQADAV